MTWSWASKVMQIKGPFVVEPSKQDMPNFKKPSKYVSKSNVKESLATTVAPVRIASKVSRSFMKRNDIMSSFPKWRPMLEERQEKSYPLLESNVLEMFDDFMSTNLIELLEMKWPQQGKQTNNPNYCKYHRLINHPIE